MDRLARGEAAAVTAEARYDTTVGLEIHVELGTDSKMFCGCAVAFAGEPNTRTCPVCLGLPGTLPVANARAVEYTIRIGRALGCSIARRSLFHRKNYFYPDMPKNYQISQYDLPLCYGGAVELQGEAGPVTVGITRVHLEEDTGKSTHAGTTGRIRGSEYSLEDFNRAGTPLVEIVTEPDLHSADDAMIFVTELRAILEALGVSDVRMEEGSLRVDANISVRRAGETEHGTKVEVKNMNSIRSVGRALAHEEERQRAALAEGEMLVQETRHFDEKSGVTSAGRTKEVSSDYRYFPEPDLVPLEPDEQWVKAIDESLPEMPAERRRRFCDQYGVSEKEALLLTETAATGDWFETAARAYGGEGKKVANWILGDLYGLLNERGVALSGAKVTPEGLAALVAMVDEGKISGKQAKGVLAAMFDSGEDAEKIAEEQGLRQISDASTLDAVVDEVVAAHADVADKVRAGNAGPVGFLVGQVMKKTRGQANPQVVNELLRARLTP
jgi:aspartyl-tRNA(Asn)/glutamyl-tRNA(Gln) amidotransferase subunit B